MNFPKISLLNSPAQDADMVVELEKLLSRWMEQVEEMLIKSEQIRREEENFGPSAELTYCKSRMEQIDTSVRGICLFIKLHDKLFTKY